jgi:hypothetical protein
VAADILRGESRAWMPVRLLGERSCDETANDRVRLLRMAAESRARGWLRLRARWTAEADRASWARATLHQAPWSPRMAERRVAELRDYILVELGADALVPVGLGAYAAPLAARALCAN